MAYVRIMEKWIDCVHIVLVECLVECDGVFEGLVGLAGFHVFGVIYDYNNIMLYC